MIETTDFRKSEQYTLSIRLTADGFCFTLFNPLAGKEGAYSSVYTEADDTLPLCGNLKKAIGQTEWLNNSFGKVHVVVAESTRYTLVPLDIFEDDQAEKLFHQNITAEGNELVSYHISQKTGIVTLFGIDESTHDYLRSKYPNAKFYVEAGALIDYLAQKSKAGNAKKLYIHLSPKTVTVYGFESGHLLLCNTFDISQVSDVAYHTLHCWKGLQLDQEQDELYLSGTFAQQEELAELLRRYLQNVFVISSSEHVELEALLSCE